MQRAFRLEPRTWKLIALAALVAAAAIGFWPYLAPALRLLLGGGAIAFLLDPLCQRLCVRLKRPLAAGVAILGVAAALIGLVLLLAPFMVRQVGALADAIPSSVAAVRALVERVEGFFRNKGIALGSLAANLDWNAVSGLLSGALGSVVGFFGNLAAGISSFGMMVVLAYFFLADRDNLLLRLEMLVPLAHRALAIRMAGAVKRELLLYLRGQALISLLVGALASVALLLAGLPSALVLGSLIGVLNLVPYFGPILGGIPAVILALGGGWRRVAFVLLALVAVQQIDGALISPRVMGGLTGVSPASVLLAIAIGSSVGGIAGMLFALPVLLILRISLRVWAQRRETD